MPKTIKVKELIKWLQTFEPESLVFLSSDEEGNSYSTINVPGSIDASAEYTDGIITLIPWQEGLDYEEIAPRMVQTWKD